MGERTFELNEPFCLAAQIRPTTPAITHFALVRALSLQNYDI